ncbi:nucleoside phosphorylase [Roseococcus sp. SDR]|uniref:phosphorylase family protein n=1 Tax=Roseococcus sp. SDR TaxID=2835532 RepID=UPI001BCFC129|nr:nucleoside phosphorylase [Roseococcus sp. SDR]MBS7790477.1 nucleoside phosphorylase [Roseococcus sp. SDR]MBV1845791.1 nucleoside phosphorylase [Roseococcus sp. SDR]
MVEAIFPPGCVVVVGLKSEAALLPAGVRCIVSGGDPARLATLWPADAAAVLSFGIAGGLAPDVATGDVLVASALWEAGVARAVDAAWSATLQARCKARSGVLAASDALLDSGAAKAALYRASGALAVDMESGAAWRFAAARGLPFAALRAVADGPRDVLPEAAAVGLNPDGSPAPGRVLRALLRRPQDLPALLRLARASAAAHAALRRVLASAAPAL